MPKNDTKSNCTVDGIGTGVGRGYLKYAAKIIAAMPTITKPKERTFMIFASEIVEI